MMLDGTLDHMQRMATQWHRTQFEQVIMYLAHVHIPNDQRPWTSNKRRFPHHHLHARPLSPSAFVGSVLFKKIKKSEQ